MKQQGFEKALSRVEEAWQKYAGKDKEPEGWIAALVQPLMHAFARRVFFDAWELALKEPCCIGMAVEGNMHSGDCPLSVHHKNALHALMDERNEALARIKALEGGIVAENNRVQKQIEEIRQEALELFNWDPLQ